MDSRQNLSLPTTSAAATPFTSGPNSNGASNASFTSMDEPSMPLFPPNITTSSSQQEFASTTTPQPALVVFSGGTAFNSVASHVRHLTTRVAHILPVSDDGGSTAEIVRVLGGPAVGDIRSRCLRLADDSDKEAQAVRHLLAYRLSARSPEEAKREWYEIVEGNHKLWEVSF
jgi:2-phospho-L-lactate transferase CofD